MMGVARPSERTWFPLTMSRGFPGRVKEKT